MNEQQWVDRETLKEVLRELLVELNKPHRCPLEDAGVGVEEHKEHHKTLQKIAKDVSSVRKAFLMGVATTVTGGIFGLVWLFLKTKCGEYPWLLEILRGVKP